MVTCNLRDLSSGSPKLCISALKCVSLHRVSVVCVCFVKILKCSDAIVMRTTELPLREAYKRVIFQVKRVSILNNKINEYMH